MILVCTDALCHQELTLRPPAYPPPVSKSAKIHNVIFIVIHGLRHKVVGYHYDDDHHLILLYYCIAVEVVS